MIVRGTTPTIRYTFSNVDIADIATCYLTIKQGTTVIEKTLQDATAGDGYLDWVLSQAETLSLDENQNAEVQIRYKMTSGMVYASTISTGLPYKILKQGEI